MATKNKFRRRIKKNNLNSISIVLPVYNEKEIIEIIADKLTNLLNKNFKDYEIVIVESGSTDGSRELVDKLAKKNKHIVAVHQARREGLGSGLIEGFENCNKDAIFYMDSDMPFDLNYIIKAFPFIKKYDAIIGYKTGKRENFSRALYSKVYNFLINIIFNLKVKDVNYSFKMFRKNVIKNLNLISKGWFIDAEILAELKKHKHSIYQIPVPYIPRIAGKSTINIGFKTIKGILLEMFNYIKKSY